MNHPTGNSKNPLGKGLAALLGEIEYMDDDLSQGLRLVPVHLVEPGKMQPRVRFDPEKMQNLVESVRTRGVLQPILVREINNGRYEIIAGERRWRAAKEAEIGNIPIIVHNCSDKEALELGLIENLQRDDLNPMEEAESLKKLIEEFGNTQEVVAQSISKSRSYVANLVRLTTLPENVKEMIRDGRLTAGHAKAILSAPDIEQAAQRIINENLTVRQSETMARAMNPEFMMNQIKPATPGTKVEKTIDPDLIHVSEMLSHYLEMETQIDLTRRGGIIKIRF